MEAIVVCTSEGEMYNVWLPPHECLVCACVSHTGILMPLCARCDGCNAPLEPFVVPEQEPTEITLRPPIPNGTKHIYLKTFSFNSSVFSLFS